MVSKEELSKFSKYGHWMNLKGMWGRVKDLFGYMNGIGDDNDLGNAISIWGLVDTLPNGEEFGFGTSNMNCMVNSLGNGVIVSVRMRYRCSNFILDASICDYYSGR